MSSSIVLKYRVPLVVFLAALLSISAACSSTGADLDSSKEPFVNTHTTSLHLEVSEDYSCPYLYSWDGGEFRMENDIYSVARGPDREFIDYLYINNPVVTKDGLYSFRLKERQSEESWTDYVALMVIDHPPGTMVGVDSSGRVHSFTTPATPLSAVDDDGNNVLTDISLKDGLSAALYHLSHITLDFSNVDISDAAKLVIDVDGFEGDLSGNLTFEIPSINIQTLKNGSWTTRYKFFPKEMRAEGVFDLKPFLGESQAVRLESVSCYEGKYHDIDYVALDDSFDECVSHIVTPVKAESANKDLLGDLSASDDSYAYLDEAGIVDLSFPVPGFVYDARSFAFISEGYYHIKGSTFYVQTWDGTQWVEHESFEPLDYHQDTMAQFDLSEYLPDADGDYKVKIEHRVASGVYQSAEGNMDYVYLTLDGKIFRPVSAVSPQDGDILAQIEQQDDVRWLATNKSVIVKFIPATG